MSNELILVAQGLLNYMLLLSVQLLLILLLRKKIAQRFGAVIAYRLWFLPLLWLPFYWIELPAPDFSLLQIISGTEAGTADTSASWLGQAFTALNFTLELPTLNFMQNSELLASRLWLGSSLLWLVGSLALLALQLVHIRSFSRQLARLSTSEDENDCETSSFLPLPTSYLSGLASPALYGVLRPRLLLPPNFSARYDAQQRRLILAHEAVHLRRHDNMWNLLGTLARVLFWFNPLVHLAWKYYRLDQEMSCDEIALRESNPEEGLRYARTLLETMSNSLNISQQPTLTAWGNLREIRERTQMIKFHVTHKPLPQPGKWLLLFCILAGSFATIVFTDKMQMSFAAEDSSPAVPSQALTRPVYERIEKVMALRDAGDYVGALAILDELKTMNDAGSLNTREQKTLWLFYANMAQLEERYQDAFTYNLNILGIEGISKEVREQTLNQLGSLAYVLEDYETAIDYFKQVLETDSAGEINLRIAYAYYQLEQSQAALPFLEEAITRGKNSKNSYSLLRAIHLQNENYPAALATARTMVDLFDDPDDRKLLQQIEYQIDPSNMAIDSSVLLSVSNYQPITVFKPKYPLEAVAQAIEGWVQVEFTVNEKGDVIDPVITDSAPKGVSIFDQASLDAVRKFKFTPKLEGGVAVATQGVQYVFRFDLESKED